MQESNKSNRAVSAIVLVVVGLIVGGAVAYPLGRSMNDDSGTSNMSMSSTANVTEDKAAGLRVTLNNLLREHVTSNLAVTYNIIDGASEQKLQASVDAENANAAAIADAVGSVYGDEAKAAVATPFLEHLTNSNNYAKAVKAGDTAAQGQSLQALQANLRQISDVFASVIPSVPSDALYDALNQHETLMNQVAEAYQNGDFTKAYELEDQALTQISGGADVLTKGIIASKPDMFKN